MENSQKIDSLLQTTLSATPAELARSPELSVGRTALPTEGLPDGTPEEILWEIIIRYTGSLPELLRPFPDIFYIELLNQYAVLKLPQNRISMLAALPQITYIEKPKRLFYEDYLGKQTSCITSLQSTFPNQYTGRGTLVGIIDSGIDYAHPDFCTDENTSRILLLWDQTIPPDAAQNRFSPPGYPLGSLFSNEQLNRALAAPSALERLKLCPSTDSSGHGTHVAGIAAGNGRASAGVFRGVAYESQLLVVKLGAPEASGFPSTTQLMLAIDFCIRESIRLSMPLALNISFGNTYGSHTGTSLLETYLNTASELGRCSVVIGSGNEGASGGHTSGSFLDSTTRLSRIEFTVSDFTPSLTIQLWKNYGDELRLSITSPISSASVSIAPNYGITRYTIGNTNLLVNYGEPSPYSIYQEIYFDLIPANSYLDAGIWSINIVPQSIQDGDWQMWMPSSAVRSEATHFLLPTPDTTLTIPSTSSRAITVGSYDSATDILSAFSGRGFTWSTHLSKPDLVAPGVDITSCAPGGGYTQRTGTSMATPFVTGSAACLMQWGIVEKHDPYLYGEKLKAYLRKGARRLPAFTDYPNPQVGWGALCLRDST